MATSFDELLHTIARVLETIMRRQNMPMKQSHYARGDSIERLDRLVWTCINTSIDAELEEEGASASSIFFTIREEAVRQEAQLFEYEGQPTEDNYKDMLREALFHGIFRTTVRTWPQ